MKQAKISLLACHYRTYTGCIKKGDHLIFINIGLGLQKERFFGISPVTGRPSSSPVMFSIFSHLNSIQVTLLALMITKFFPLAPTLVNK